MFDIGLLHFALFIGLMLFDMYRSLRYREQHIILAIIILALAIADFAFTSNIFFPIFNVCLWTFGVWIRFKQPRERMRLQRQYEYVKRFITKPLRRSRVG